MPGVKFARVFLFLCVLCVFSILTGMTGNSILTGMTEGMDLYFDNHHHHDIKKFYFDKLIFPEMGSLIQERLTDAYKSGNSDFGKN